MSIKNGKSHMFSVEVAKKIGVEKAIIIQNIAYWMEYHKSNNKHVIDGKVWIYTTSKAMSDIMPYFSQQKIKRLLKQMVEDGTLEAGNFNKTKFDRTIWYTIIDQEVVQFYKLQCSELNNGMRESEPPIPNVSTDVDVDKEKTKEKDLFEQFPMDHELEAFEEFWKLYERKGSKKKSLAYWKKLTHNERTQAIDCLEFYFKERPEKQYRKDAERFLRDKMFADVMERADNNQLNLPSQGINKMNHESDHYARHAAEVDARLQKQEQRGIVIEVTGE